MNLARISSKGIRTLALIYSFIIKRYLGSNFENYPQIDLANDCFWLNCYNVIWQDKFWTKITLLIFISSHALLDCWRISSKHLLVFKTSWRRLQVMSWRRLQHIFSVTISHLSRRLEDVLKTFPRPLARRLEDVLEDEKLLCWRRV